jgi:predicted HTH transcriptional regulator
MSPEELRSLITRRENESVEFKREAGSTKKANEDLCREMAAFANTRGGYLIFGVDDDGTIVGVDQPTKLEERLMNIASERVIPPIDPIYEVHTLEGKPVVCLQIPSGKDKPYSPRYIRRGTTKRRATREEERRLFFESGFIDYDGTSLRETVLDDLDLDKIDVYFRRTTGRGIDEFGIDRLRLLENKRILVGCSATVAGMLMFGRYPQIYLPQSAVKVVRFKGDDVGGDFIDRGELTGTLPEIIEATIKFVQRHTNQGAKIEGIRRIDIPEYPPERKEKMPQTCFFQVCRFSSDGELSKQRLKNTRPRGHE